MQTPYCLLTFIQPVDECDRLEKEKKRLEVLIATKEQQLQQKKKKDNDSKSSGKNNNSTNKTEKKRDMTQLHKLTQKWKTTSEKVLVELQNHAKLPTGETMNLVQLMQAFHIDPSLFSNFDECNDCFL